MTNYEVKSKNIANHHFYLLDKDDDFLAKASHLYIELSFYDKIEGRRGLKGENYHQS